MLKKLFSFLLIFIFIFSITNAYNESWTDLEIKTNGWCPNIETKITIYNKTDFINKEIIEDDLCGVNETVEEDRCEIFQEIEADIEIFKGPMDGLPLLYEKELTDTDNNQIKVNFPVANSYLIKIKPTTPNYNNFEDQIIISKCEFMNDDIKVYTEELDGPTTFDQTFTYETTTLILRGTSYTDKANISVITITDLKLASLPELNNSIKTIEIKFQTNNYTNLDIQIDQKYDTTSIIKLMKYDSDFKKWDEISNFKKTTNQIIIESADYGIYSITEEKVEKVIEPVKEAPQAVENNNAITLADNNQSPYLLWIIITIILTVGIITFMAINSKGKDPYHKENKSEPEKEEPKEVLDTYSASYNKTKQYVQTYKNNYSKDQVFRALKDAQVPEDIINKVFLEEY